MTVAQPLYSIFSKNPEFFVANGIGQFQIYAFVGVLSFLIPILSAGISLAALRWTRIPHLIVVFLLITLYALQLLKGMGVSYAPIAFCASIGFACALTYHYIRRPQYSFAINLLLPIVIVLPYYFLTHKNIEPLLNRSSGLSTSDIEPAVNPGNDLPPIIMVVFDEFPLIDMLDLEGDFDAKTFPNFSYLAEQATWYLNATTVATETSVAVPSILDGQLPGESRLAIHSVHPDNLFALLQEQYTLNLFESITQLAPPTSDPVGDQASGKKDWNHIRRFILDSVVTYLYVVLPDQYANELRGIDTQWGGFLGDPENSSLIIRSTEEEDADSVDSATPMEKILAVLADDRKAYFLEFVKSIEGKPKTTFHFIHSLLPHRPHKYLPSGRLYSNGDAPRGKYSDKKTKGLEGSPQAITRYHQGHRLQMGFADTLLGELLIELLRIDRFDQSLIIVCADHGMSFRKGLPVRSPLLENFADLAYVPLLIKYPDQKVSTRDSRNVQTIDIAPTVLDVLGMPKSETADGFSLLDEIEVQRETVNLYHHTLEKPIKMNFDEGLALKEKAFQRIAKRFGRDHPISNLFWYGDSLDYIGRSEDSVVQRKADVELYDVAFDISHVSGGIRGSISDMSDLQVVVTINDVIVAISSPYPYKDEWLFDLVFPDSVYTEASNSGNVFLISRR